MDMSLKAKYDFLREKRACTKCLKTHGTQPCRTIIKCSGCSRQHFHLLCPESQRNAEKKKIISSSTTCNSISSPLQAKQVLLKTILVEMKTFKGRTIIRILFDDGGQQSYIKTSLAVKSRCIAEGNYFERNTFFGGILTKVKLMVQSLSGGLKHELELPDREQFTGELIEMGQI